MMTSNEPGRVDQTEAHNSVRKISRDLLELRALKVQKDKIEEAYHQILPKVDPFLSRVVFANARRPNV
jgi:arginine repressor